MLPTPEQHARMHSTVVRNVSRISYTCRYGMPSSRTLLVFPGAGRRGITTRPVAKPPS